MKKGSAGPLVAIVLGLVVIVIILFTFGRPMVTQLQSFFAPGGLASPKQTEGGTVSGSQTAGIPTFLLSGTEEEIRVKLANLLLECWKRKDEQKYKCYQVEFDKPSDRDYVLQSVNPFAALYLTRESVTAELRRRGQSAAADSFDAETNWRAARRDSPIGVGYTGSRGVVVRSSYLMCVDYDSFSDSDLYLSDNQNFNCE